MAHHDSETVIVDHGGSSAGIIAGVVVVALVVLGLFLIFNGSFNQGTGGTIDVDVPAVSVDVVPDGQ